MLSRRHWLVSVATALTWLGSFAADSAFAQASAPAGAAVVPTVQIANLMELTGAGAKAGVSFHNGVQLAVKEINAAGGLLGRRIETKTYDTQSKPAVAVSLAQKVVGEGVFAVFGPVFSGSIMLSMAETRRGEVPNFTGGEAAAISQQGNPYIFRTSFTQAIAMPKVAYYISERAHYKSLAIIYVNNDFGKGGLEMLRRALSGSSTGILAEVSTDSGQTDFAAAVTAAIGSKPEAIFVYSNEAECARILVELRKQGWTLPIIGETTLTGQQVIDLAGAAANGAIAHVGLTVDAPIPEVRAFRASYERDFKTTPDHNAMKGYSGMWVLKAAVDKAGRLDRKLVARALKGLKVNVRSYPGALMYTEFDQKGDLDRMSFLVRVTDGHQEVLEFMPPLASILNSRPMTMQPAPSAASMAKVVGAAKPASAPAKKP